jgi:NADPH-dependent 2,4-dienoyl-CoA reductase/sulfur reductase-like enzyme
MAVSNVVSVLNDEVLVQNGDPSKLANGEVHEDTPGRVSNPKQIGCDVLVVGAGFSGISAIHRFRNLGMNVKCFESGGDFG